MCVCERHIIIYKQMTLNAHFFSFSHEQRANNLQLLQMQTKKQPLQAAEPLCEMSGKKISIRCQSTPMEDPEWPPAEADECVKCYADINYPSGQPHNYPVS